MTVYQTDYFLNERNVNCKKVRQSAWGKSALKRLSLFPPLGYRRPFNIFHLSGKARDEVS